MSQERHDDKPQPDNRSKTPGMPTMAPDEVVEWSIGLLREITKRHPDVLRDCDVESFVNDQLQPTLDDMRAPRSAVACSEPKGPTPNSPDADAALALVRNPEPLIDAAMRAFDKVSAPQSATLRMSDLMRRALADSAEMLEDFAQLEKEGPRPGSGCKSRGIEVAVYDYCDAGAEQVRSFVFTDGEAEALAALIRHATDRSSAK